MIESLFGENAENELFLIITECSNNEYALFLSCQKNCSLKLELSPFFSI